MSPNDRESHSYLQDVRPREYAVLQAVAVENFRRGCSCIIAAPYVHELRSRDWYEQAVQGMKALGAEPAMIWVRCDADKMLLHLTSRGAPRDDWKLSHWAEYLEGAEPDRGPAQCDAEIDNSRDLGPPLISQVTRLADVICR